MSHSELTTALIRVGSRLRSVLSDRPKVLAAIRGRPFLAYRCDGRGEMRRFVLLDRDGTINVEGDYISSPEQVELLPRSAAGLRAMRALGLGLVVVTNQSAVGRGYYDLPRLEEIHRRLRELLAREGVELDGIYICPHTSADGCACRKPRPGLLQRAVAELGFRAAECFVVGDKPSDIDLGKAVGATTILVRTGYGAANEAAGNTSPDHVADDLLAAAEWIGRQLQSTAAASTCTRA